MPKSPLRSPRRKAVSRDALRGRVRAHDPFELIRWLALSQPDPRKALAELVQNSLDAAAQRIRITRMRERGQSLLRIHDDGEGVIPEMTRVEALRYVATHIGHSRKRALSPEQRLALMTQGQYGIGLLGFWSLGHTLEMRSSLPGQAPHRLVLYRDDPNYVIEPIRGHLALGERWTEIIVHDLHRAVVGALQARRAADYLAGELRGQLLSRDVELMIEDRLSRGRAREVLRVRPPRFVGERIEGIGPVEVPGYPPIRFEIYLAGDATENGGDGGGRGLAIYSTGTLVAEDFHELAALGLDRSPWTDPRLSGLVDFAGFHVAPGSRRGVMADEAATAFAAALASIEPVLESLLESLERRRMTEMDRALIRDLQRAFRDFYRHRPRYALLPVTDNHDESAGPEDGRRGLHGEVEEGTGPAAADAGAAADESPEASPTEEPVAPEQQYLLPPGPLSRVEIHPASIRVSTGSSRRLSADALDETGRMVEESVAWEWSITPEAGALRMIDETAGARDARMFEASTVPADGRVMVRAWSAARDAIAEAPVEVIEGSLAGGASNEGIPEPEFVQQPGAAWRSRISEEGRWQVNAGHREYRVIADQPALKLRYLAMLFAKEVVMRSHQDPRLENPLEQLVEVAAYADRNLASKRRRRGKKTAGEGSGGET